MQFARRAPAKLPEQMDRPVVEGINAEQIVISSPHAALPAADNAAYGIAIAAQETLMLALAEEVKGSGVTANVLRVRTIDANHERDRQPTLDARRATWTTPEELASAVLYLCSDEAQVVNGARIPMYGSP